MLRLAFITLLVACGISCRRPASARLTGPVAPSDAAVPPSRPSTADDDGNWPGVYASPSEIRRFSRTVLVLDAGPEPAEHYYRMWFTSDFFIANAIPQKERTGFCLAEGDRLYLPEASGAYVGGRPRLSARLTRYTRLTINGQDVLMRDDALRAYREKNKLYDYGILIRVAGGIAGEADLRRVEAPSVKLLSEDPAVPWRDPFVHGPNER